MTEAGTKPSGRWMAIILGGLLVLCGLLFTAGGGYLVALSGSP